MRQVFLVFIFCFSVMLSPAFAADEVAPEITTAFEEGKAAYDAGDYDRAYEIWLPLAEGGHSESQFRIGNLYRKGFGVEQNHFEEKKWLERAANQNHAKSQFNLSILLGRSDSPVRSSIESGFWMFVAQKNRLPQAEDAIELYRKEEVLQEILPRIEKDAEEWLKRNHSSALED